MVSKYNKIYFVSDMIILEKSNLKKKLKIVKPFGSERECDN